jgi:hypothetical protein
VNVDDGIETSTKDVFSGKPVVSPPSPSSAPTFAPLDEAFEQLIHQHYDEWTQLIEEHSPMLQELVGREIVIKGYEREKEVGTVISIGKCK